MSALETRITAAGRSRVHSLLRRVGATLAELDQRRLPHRVLVAALPLAVRRRFDPQAATDLEATLELRIRDPHGGEPACFALHIGDRRCVVSPGRAASPHAAATLGADDMIRLASGAAGWPELLSAGRLELGGDPYLGLRVPNLFRLPVAAGAG